MAYIPFHAPAEGSDRPATAAYKYKTRKATLEEAKELLEKTAKAATGPETLFVLDEDTMTIACWAKYVPGVVKWVSPESEELRRVYNLPSEAP